MHEHKRTQLLTSTRINRPRKLSKLRPYPMKVDSVPTVIDTGSLPTRLVHRTPRTKRTTRQVIRYIQLKLFYRLARIFHLQLDRVPIVVTQIPSCRHRRDSTAGSNFSRRSHPVRWRLVGDGSVEVKEETTSITDGWKRRGANASGFRGQERWAVRVGDLHFEVILAFRTTVHGF